jgi:hypothetical protein
MGISRLDQLPELPDMNNGEGLEKLQEAINQLQENEKDGQITMEDVVEKAAEE